jgi:hypothetical protein
MHHRRIPCFSIATVLALTACSSTHPSAITSPSIVPPTTAALRAEPPVPPQDQQLVRAALEQWRALTAGHTVTYTASSECIVCATPGHWKVVERDGTLVSAAPLDGQDPAAAGQVPTVTDVLLAAAAARGAATATVTATHVFVAYDTDPQVSDDEGDISAENIVVG